MASEEVLVVFTRIGTALVGMMEHPLGRPTTRQRHLERLHDEMPVVDGTDGPADEKAREEVEHGRQVEFSATPNHELRRIGDPPLVGRFGDKVLRQHVGRDRLIVVAHRGDFVSLTHPRLEALFLHQTNDPLTTDPFVLLDQVFVNPRTAVPMCALLE